LIKSIQSIPRMDFSVIEMGSPRDKQSVISSLFDVSDLGTD